MNIDVVQIRNNLLAQSEGIVGEDYKEQRAFQMLFPQILAMKSNGFSYAQITHLLCQNGLPIQRCKVKGYYMFFLYAEMQECVRQTEAQIEILAMRAESKAGKPEAVGTAPIAHVTGGSKGLRCLPLQSNIAPLARREGVPEEVYLVGLLEHPAIPGLMLTVDERVYGGCLEIQDEKGEMRFETMKERPFRIKWQKPIPRTKTYTDGDFVDINPALFKNEKA